MNEREKKGDGEKKARKKGVNKRRQGRYKGGYGRYWKGWKVLKEG